MKPIQHALLAVFLGTATLSFADTEVVDGITWTYTLSNGQASVGKGDYSSTAVPPETIGAVTIPSTLGGCPVTSIGDFAFYECYGLRSITIPESVTSIGRYAFFDCSWLTSVTIPDGVTSIGGSAFEGCSDLTSITIPNGVTNIWGSAFSGCSGLTSVTIPDGVTSIRGSTFEGCSRLTSITIPDGVTSIGSYAFYGCSGLTSITIPDGVTSIGAYTFYNCSGLTSITIPDGVTSIGASAFWGCQGLKTITIPASVSSLGSYVFGRNTVSTQSSICPLSTVYLMEGSPLTRGSLKAAGMRSAAKVRIRVSRNANGAAWTFYVDESGNATIENIVPPADGNIRIPEDFEEWPVVGIEKGAFANCTDMETLMIPAGITTIGEQALIHCTGLKTLFLHRDCTLSEEEIRSSVRLVDTCEIVRWTSTDLPVISFASVAARPSHSAVVRIDVSSLGSGNSQATVTAKIANVAETSAILNAPGSVELTLDGIPFGRDYSVSVSVVAPSGLCDARSLPLSMTAAGGDWSSGGDANWIQNGNDGSPEWTSGAISKGESSWLSFPVDGKGRLTFSWKISAGRGDFCRVYLGETLMKSITRSVDWAEVSVDVPDAGNHVFRWEYQRGTGEATGDDAAMVRDVEWKPETALVVESGWGTPVPAAGTHALFFGESVTATVVEPEAAEGVRRVCTGWTGTGSVPAAGRGTNVVFALQEDSSLAWNWQTEYWCEISVSGGRSDFASSWIAEGTAVAIEIVPDMTPCTVSVDGDAGGVSVEGTILRFVADRPRTICVMVERSELTLASALDATGLVWTTDGVAPWFPQTEVSNDGVDAAKSGTVPDGSSVSALQTTVAGAGSFTWVWKADIQGNAGVDLLLDGVWLDSYAIGEDWSRETLTVADEGEHVIRFEFWNAGTGETLSDCAYVDRVSWTPAGGGSVVVEGGEIPVAWLDGRAASFVAAADGDHEAAARATAANGRPVWECYVADLDPDDPDDDLVATIEMVGGQANVSILKGEKATRTYEVQGAPTPAGPWGERNSDSRFFRIRTTIPE